MIRIPKVTMTMRELDRAPACTALVYVDDATSRLMVWRRAATDANQVLIHWADLYRELLGSIGALVGDASIDQSVT